MDDRLTGASAADTSPGGGSPSSTPTSAPISDRLSTPEATTRTSRTTATATLTATRTTVDLLVPVYDEEAQLRHSVERLLAETADSVHDVTIVVADNASTDATGAIGRELATTHDRVRYVRLEQKGRGRALNRIWSTSDAEVLAYTDVDLATDIRLLDPMVSVLAAGTADLAIASRLLPDSRVERGVFRELVSRCYNRLLRGTMDVDFSDAQCGFKAVSRQAARALLPHVTDTAWFFDTELLTLARWSGLRVHEFAADWTDDPDSSVDVVRTARDDLRGMFRMRRTLAAGEYPLDEIAAVVGQEPAMPNTGAQILHFVDVGILCTLAYSLAFVLLGSVMDPQVANVFALLGCTVLNTALNRRYSFGVRNPEGLYRHHVKGLLVFVLCWALTAGALTLTAGLDGPWAPVEVLVAVTAANLLATVLRFLLQRIWVFARPPAARGRTAADHLARSTSATGNPS
ncbi:glycosyltransferase [Brevibacterium litoralis]|uniref:glycosyltransferase n=1 Tax=Brevibacterium litoralis TaxID=3138935 RepID=UPI0032EE2A14